MKLASKILSLVLAAAVMISLCACGGSTDSPTPAPDTNTVQMPEGSTFSIEFFDVGHADAALIECDGNYMLIDGGNKADSQKMYAILKEKEIAHLEYVIATNINVEHIGGLAGALNYATAGITFCPVDSNDTDAFNDFKKYADKNGGGITVPKAGNKYKLGVAEMEFVAVNGKADTDCGLIVKITYGNTVFLFAGNNHIVTEQMAVDSDTQLKATLLKVAAHGGDNASGASFIREVQPEYAVISTDGQNGCPGTTTVSVLEISGTQLYRTDLHGDISLTSDGNTVTFTTEKQPDESAVYLPGTGKETKPQTTPEATEKPAPTPTPAAKPTPAPTSKPTEAPEPTEKPVSPAGIDELYDANLMTNLVSAYGSMKQVSHYMGATHVMGSFMVDGKLAYLNSHIYPGNVCSYNGWYAGYSFNDYGMRPTIIVDPEKLEGEQTPPNQTDLAYYFVNKDSVEYLGKSGEDFLYKVTKDPFVYTLTVDSQSFAVKKAEYYDGSELETIEYIYGEWVEGQDILDAWQNGTGMKVVSIYADLYDGAEHKSYFMPLYLPLGWEVDVFSGKYNCALYMDANYTQFYQYPGDGVNYELYITNAVG